VWCVGACEPVCVVCVWFVRVSVWFVIGVCVLCMCVVCGACVWCVCICGV
jgi:hypothetical protein